MIRTGLKYGLLGMGVSLGKKSMKSVKKGLKHN